MTPSLLQTLRDNVAEATQNLLGIVLSALALFVATVLSSPTNLLQAEAAAGSSTWLEPTFPKITQLLQHPAFSPMYVPVS